MKIKNKFTADSAGFIIFPVCLMYILLCPGESSRAVHEGCTLFYRSILPVMFPFFVISTFAAESGLCHSLGMPVRRILKKHFGINSGEYTYMISVLSGYPNSARIISAGRNDRIISKRDAQILLILCSNGSAAFILSYIGSSLLQSKSAAFILLFANYFSPAVTAKILSSKALPDREIITASSAKPDTDCISAFINAVNSSVTGVLNAGAFIIFFSVLRSLVMHVAPPSKLFTVLSSAVELSAGCGIIAGEISDMASAVGILGFLIGSGGMCVIFQCLSFIGNTDLDKTEFVKYKLLCGAVSGATSFTLAKIFLTDVPDIIKSIFTATDVNPLNLLLLGILLFIILIYSIKKDSENKT